MPTARRELPNLEKAQRLVGKDKLTVFAVSHKEISEAASGIKALASKWQMIDDHYGSIASHFGISAIPHLFIIGRDGNVLANHVGYGDRSLDELVDDINHALSGTPPAEQPDAPATTGSTWRTIDPCRTQLSPNGRGDALTSASRQLPRRPTLG